MGECVYYLKAKFATEEKARNAAEKLSEALAELDKAYDFWQKNRGKTPAEFWSNFEAEFPHAMAILKVTPGFELGGDCNNNLAGKLSYCENGEPQVEVFGKEIRYSAEVWHFADWDGLKNWIESALEAEAVTWASDEGIDPFDAIAYEDD